MGGESWSEDHSLSRLSPPCSLWCPNPSAYTLPSIPPTHPISQIQSLCSKPQTARQMYVGVGTRPPTSRAQTHIWAQHALPPIDRKPRTPPTFLHFHSPEFQTSLPLSPHSAKKSSRNCKETALTTLATEKAVDTQPARWVHSDADASSLRHPYILPGSVKCAYLPTYRHRRHNRQKQPHGPCTHTL